MFVLTEDQKMIKELANNLAHSELKKYAAEVDNDARFPVESIEVLAESGLMGTIVPEDMSGAGLDALSHVLVTEEVAKVCSSTAAILTENTAVQAALLRFGSPEQQENILPQLAAGKLASVAVRDGDADSSLTELTTTAEEQNGAFVLNGTKRYVENIGYSDWYLVAAAVKDAGVTLFLLDKDTPGVQLGKISQKMGQRACITGELLLEHWVVPASAGLGGMGNAGAVIGEWEDYLHLGSAAQAVGVTQGAMETVIQYVNERIQFGKRIAQFQNTQQHLAFLQARLEAARLLLWFAASKKAAGEDCSAQCAMAKVVAADLANDATRKGVQFMGGFGYSREYPMERMMRDAKMIEIYGGYMEEMKTVIADSIGVI